MLSRIRICIFLTDFSLAHFYHTSPIVGRLQIVSSEDLAHEDSVPPIHFEPWNRDAAKRRLTTSVDALLFPAPTTEGPLGATPADYTSDSSDLLQPANALNRTAVLDGLPFNLTFRVYAVPPSAASASAAATPLQNATVWLWHTDAAGRYSAISDPRWQAENTAGQKWLRGWRNTDANGTALFQTIIPGWYPGRCLHMHFRIGVPRHGQPPSTDYGITSHLFFADEFLSALRQREPYSGNAAVQTPLLTDGIFFAAAPGGGVGGRALTFNYSSSTSSAPFPASAVTMVDGDFSTGYAGQVRMGIYWDGTVSTTGSPESPQTVAVSTSTGTAAGDTPSTSSAVVSMTSSAAAMTSGAGTSSSARWMGIIIVLLVVVGAGS